MIITYLKLPHDHLLLEPFSWSSLIWNFLMIIPYLKLSHDHLLFESFSWSSLILNFLMIIPYLNNSRARNQDHSLICNIRWMKARSMKDHISIPYPAESRIYISERTKASLTLGDHRGIMISFWSEPILSRIVSYWWDHTSRMRWDRLSWIIIFWLEIAQIWSATTFEVVGSSDHGYLLSRDRSFKEILD